MGGRLVSELAALMVMGLGLVVVSPELMGWLRRTDWLVGWGEKWREDFEA